MPHEAITRPPARHVYPEPRLGLPAALDALDRMDRAARNGPALGSPEAGRLLLALAGAYAEALVRYDYGELDGMHAAADEALRIVERVYKAAGVPREVYEAWRVAMVPPQVRAAEAPRSVN